MRIMRKGKVAAGLLAFVLVISLLPAGTVKAAYTVNATYDDVTDENPTTGSVIFSFDKAVTDQFNSVSLTLMTSNYQYADPAIPEGKVKILLSVSIPDGGITGLSNGDTGTATYSIAFDGKTYTGDISVTYEVESYDAGESGTCYSYSLGGNVLADADPRAADISSDTQDSSDNDSSTDTGSTDTVDTSDSSDSSSVDTTETTAENTTETAETSDIETAETSDIETAETSDIETAGTADIETIPTADTATDTTIVVFDTSGATTHEAIEQAALSSPEFIQGALAAATNTSNAYTIGNITASSAEGALPAGGQITAAIVTGGATYDTAAAALGSTFANAPNKQMQEIDLKSSDGALVHELSGYVSVAVPLPFTPAAGNTIVVYRIDGNTAVRLASQMTNDAVIFTTNHFSTYVFVEENADVAAITSPATSDAGGTAMLLVLAAAASLAVVATIKCRV